MAGSIVRGMRSPSGSGGKILVVDDNPQILVMVTTRLENRGYTVSSAEDGEQALLKVREDPPDLVILDVMMPKKNGWEVARAIRQTPITAQIKIVMLTAIGESINEMTSSLYGADAHLDKPFDFGDLERIIKRLMPTGRAP
jgi:DNA-binding response OmpR family regulator